MMSCVSLWAFRITLWAWIASMDVDMLSRVMMATSATFAFKWVDEGPLVALSSLKDYHRVRLLLEAMCLAGDTYMETDIGLQTVLAGRMFDMIDILWIASSIGVSAAPLAIEYIRVTLLDRN